MPIGPTENVTGAQRQSQVTEQMNALESAVESVEVAVCCLRERISPVLRDEPTPKFGEGTAPEHVVVEHADLIRQIRYRVDAAAEALNVIRQSVEL